MSEEAICPDPARFLKDLCHSGDYYVFVYGDAEWDSAIEHLARSASLTGELERAGTLPVEQDRKIFWVEKATVAPEILAGFFGVPLQVLKRRRLITLPTLEKWQRAEAPSEPNVSYVGRA